MLGAVSVSAPFFVSARQEPCLLVRSFNLRSCGSSALLEEEGQVVPVLPVGQKFAPGCLGLTSENEEGEEQHGAKCNTGAEG